LLSQHQPIVFSFFSGSGFLDLGFELTGFDVRFINEFHKPFLDAYKYSRLKMGIPAPEYGYYQGSIDDLITGEESHHLTGLVNKAKKEALTGFIGGPPCPDFSVAGKNKGSDGENGVLTRVYIDAIVKNQPDFFLFENVKGLWRTAKHRAFYEEMKLKLQEAGYVVTDRLTNCIEFGVPQDRDRILMFGINRKHVPPQLSNEQLKVDFDWEHELKFKKADVLDKSIWPQTSDYIENSKNKMPEHLEPFRELTVDHWFNKNEVTRHPNSEHHFKPYSGKFKTIPEGDDSKKSFKRLHRFRYSPTAAYGNNEVHLHPYQSRRLSAAEALAIQSLPKGFELPPTMTLSDMFKTIGNGVPFLAAEGLAKTILAYLQKI